MYIREFLNGYSFDAYDYFGAHKKDDAIIFRTYAPNAKAVSVIGEFNDWTDTIMINLGDGVWEVSVKEAKFNQMYKYKIYKDGYTTEHSDPYGYYMQLRPNSASIIYDIDEYKFCDKSYMNDKKSTYDMPLNIYEMHIGAWIRDEENNTYDYDEISERLIEYLKEHNYNAVEFMPITEYPADISWGYQSTGFFSATSRYGEPKKLQYLIDSLHQNNIMAIMDFVPVHFAVDDYALGNYDGKKLYEQEHNSYSEWGSYNFDHSKGIVKSFLKSCANFWIKKYHFDGLRMDAVSRIIYYEGNKNFGVNNAGIDFLKGLNSGLKNLNDNIILIAEDSSDYKKVTDDVKNGGLGFDYKWDMGWMNDTLDFFRSSTEKRRENYYRLSFSMMYFYNEKFLLPLSHDENVHSKATIVQKMYGDYEDKFTQARAFYAYMYTHPGKKLNFMGSELGHLREFDENRQLDFDILKYPMHDSFNKYMKDLSNLYMSNSALYEKDYDSNGHKWLIVEDIQGVVYSYIRKSEIQVIVCVFNFSNEYHKNYQYECKNRVLLREILNSNWDIYSGKYKKEDEYIKSICVKKEEIYSSYKDFENTDVADTIDTKVYYTHYVKMDIPPYTARLFELVNIDEWDF